MKSRLLAVLFLSSLVADTISAEPPQEEVSLPKTLKSQIERLTPGNPVGKELFPFFELLGYDLSPPAGLSFSKGGKYFYQGGEMDVTFYWRPSIPIKEEIGAVLTLGKYRRPVVVKKPGNPENSDWKIGAVAKSEERFSIGWEVGRGKIPFGVEFSRGEYKKSIDLGEVEILPYRQGLSHSINKLLLDNESGKESYLLWMDKYLEALYPSAKGGEWLKEEIKEKEGRLGKEENLLLRGAVQVLNGNYGEALAVLKGVEAKNLILKKKLWQGRALIGRGLCEEGEKLVLEAFGEGKGSLNDVDSVRLCFGNKGNNEKVRSLGQTYFLLPENKIGDGDFEKTVKEQKREHRDKRGERWGYFPFSGVNIFRDEDFKFRGKSSLRIDFLGSENGAYNHLRRSVSVEPLKEYTFSMAVKTANITEGSGVVVYLHNGEKSISSPVFKGTEEWRRWRVVIKSGASAKRFHIEVSNHVGGDPKKRMYGSVWLDDFGLYEKVSERKEN